jgi:hypothetical protein
VPENDTLGWYTGRVKKRRAKMSETFIRRVDGDFIKKMKSEPLWEKFLFADCKSGKVFLAIRDNAVDFYYKGGRLFRYTSKGFGTDVKYATTLQKANDDLFKEGIVYESELANLKPVSDFTKNYEKVKQNCENHNKDSEASLVSNLYHKHSYLSDSGIVVLDIEIAFSPLQKGNTQDRIDILLLDFRTLRFVEAKRLSDPRLYSRTTPEVIDQLERYEQQLQGKKDEVQSEYCRYIENLNMIFDMDLPHPQTVDTAPTLWIFYYGIEGREKIDKEIMSNPQYRGKKVYAAGDAKKTSPETIWKKAKVVP